MKLKPEPIKPHHNSFHDVRTEVADFDISYSLDGLLTDIIKQLQDLENKYPGCTATVGQDRSGCYYESDTPSLKLYVYTVITAKQIYKKALKEYEIKKAAWDKWSDENREEIEAELRKRALKEKLKLNKKMVELEEEIDKWSKL